MDTTKPAPPRTARALALRALRFILIVWGVVVTLATATLYALDASPLDSVDLRLSLSWSRPGDTPAPSHRATGAIKVQP